MCTAVNLSVISLNVRGIREQTKRRSIFSFLKDQEANVYFLQETYSQPADENVWKNEWGGKIFFSHGTNHSKGVCTLISPFVNCQMDYSYANTSGRIILVTIVLGTKKLSLCNIYAPNDQSNQLEFMQELNNCIIDKTELTTLIVGGDWNCTLSKKDKIGGAPWKPSNYSNLVLTTMDMFDLVDIQRVRHPKLCKFTYESKSLKMKSRLDFFLVAKTLTRSVKNSEIYPSIAPDHNAIYISLSWSSETPRGPGLWKFNNTLLNDEQYTAMIRSTYAETRSYYSHLEDKRLLWEMIKMEIRSASISYAKHKVKASHQREKEIKRQLNHLDAIICSNFFSTDINHVLQEYENLKIELRSIYEDRGKQAMFRAKCRWIENGERPTKYFFNLEKRNYNKKTIGELRLQDGSTTKNEKSILNHIEAFYKDLLSSQITFNDDMYNSFVQNLQLPKLSDDERDSLDGPLRFDECKKVLETFQSDKSPGEDGFTAEFYKFFFDLLGNDLIASFNEAHVINELTVSQRRGVITLIPKDDGSLLELENWRPITLLNVDFKIAAKVIAKRIEPVLPKLIHPDQTGFVKGRYIGENIRLISDVMECTKVQNIPGILLSLDFRKAFDSIEWPFIMKTLDYFNFGAGIKKWVSTFYTNIESAVLNNGFTTDWFKPSRGVRQGCPLSPYLFILSAEILAHKIRQDPEFKGIKLFGNNVKLSLFADDTNLFTTDLDSVKRGLEIVDEFGKMAGLCLNIKKTKAMWLGKWAKNKSNPLGMKWSRSPVRILGVHFSYDDKGNDELNFNQKLKVLQTKLDMWGSRDLTLFGKVMIIKTLGISQLIYSASNLTVPAGIEDSVKTKCFKFLWRNKKDKIKRSGLYQDTSKGGLCMTDMSLMFKSLKLAWIPRILSAGKKNWCTVPDHYFRKMGGLNFLLRCNYNVNYFDKLPVFYKTILESFSELKTLHGYEQSQNLVLFNNKDILVGGRPVYLHEWFKRGIVFVNDLLNENGKFLTFKEFSDKYECTTNFLQYYQVISAIPTSLLTKANDNATLNKIFFTSGEEVFKLNDKVEINLGKARCKDFYKLLNNKTHMGNHSGPTRWCKSLSLNEDDWSNIYKSLKNGCKENKLREFHFKFIHRIIVTKRELFKFGIKNDEECLYCGQNDSIDHTFIECTFTRTFINIVIQWFNSINACWMSPTTEEILFGVFSNSQDKKITRKFNYTILFMRHYLYTNKLNEKSISLKEFVPKVEYKYRLENI